MAGYIKKNNEFIPLTGDGYGLPLGTWISYEGTCPDGFIESEQTFNTTTYASLYAMLGTNKVPERFDHSKLSAPETLDASLFNNGYEMPYDGIVYLAAGATTPALQYFVSADNGITWIQVGQLAGQNPVNASVSITAKKGWIIKGSGSYTCCGMFYKRHLAIKATPAYVEPDTVSDMVHTMRVQDSYSTEEVNTGKKWIDGKPIYRKVFTGLNIATTTQGWFATNIDSHDIDCIVHSQLMGVDMNALYQENEIECNGMVAVNKNTKKLDIVTVGYSIIVKKIVLEYTKTTD